MRCSVCGENGHNARTCSKRDRATDVAPKDHALWIKYDNITPEEADKLLKEAIDAKSKVAPDGRAAFAKGRTPELPERIRDALKLPDQGGPSAPKKIK